MSTPAWPTDWRDRPHGRLTTAEMIAADRDDDRARAEHIARCTGCDDCTGGDE